MTRSSAIKQELTGDYSEPMIIGPEPPLTRPISVSSTTTAMNDLGVDSSPPAAAAADVEMEGAMNGTPKCEATRIAPSDKAEISNRH